MQKDSSAEARHDNGEIKYCDSPQRVVSAQKRIQANQRLLAKKYRCSGLTIRFPLQGGIERAVKVHDGALIPAEGKTLVRVAGHTALNRAVPLRAHPPDRRSCW